MSGKGAWSNNPVKNFLTPSLITMQNLVTVSHTMCAHKKLRDLGASTPYDGAWLTPLEHAPMCYHAEFGHSMSDGMSVCTEMYSKK